MAWLTRLTVTSGYVDILGPLLIISISAWVSPSFLLRLRRSPVCGHSETGLASALLNTNQQVGGALGLSVLATIAIDATKSKAQSLVAAAHGHATGATTAIATTHGYTTAFGVAAGIALAGFVVSLVVIRVPRPAAPAEHEVTAELAGAAAK